MIILDTNVISELMDRHASADVVAWTNRQKRDKLVTTSVCVMEIHAGILKLKPGRRRTELADFAAWALEDILGGRILNFDRRAAIEAAEWHAHRRKQGRTIETADSMIAGIALARRIPLATRNIDHFDGLAVKVINPWATGA